MKGNIHSSGTSTKSPIQDKPKEKHSKTHTNQSDKSNTKKNIKSNKGEAVNNIQGKPHKDISLFFSKPEGMA